MGVLQKASPKGVMILPMLQRVERFIRHHNLLQPGDRLLVAVSGGPDSVCLLHVLHRLSASWGWSLIVAHLEHGFRGEASLGDACFVKRLADELGWPVVIEHRDLPQIIASQGGSSQDVSRRERHQFLQQTARAQQVQAIALAHQREDQAETVLLHLLRGAGLAGLAGMSAREVREGQVPLVRPLLAESKADILGYLRQQQVGFRVDASNALAAYSRNRLRLEVFPVLKTINPDVEAALARAAEVMQAEDAYLQQLAEAAFDQVCQRENDSLFLHVTYLDKQPLALRRRVLRLAWQEVNGHAQDLTFAHVEAALRLLTQPVGTVTSWPLAWQVRRSFDALVLERVQADPSREVYELPIPGIIKLASGQGQIEARIIRVEDFSGFSNDPFIAYCDLQALGTRQLQVRYWQAGDWFYPLGLGGRKKLQDFFIDEKVDRRERERIPLVVKGSDIVWVAGQRLDERWRVTSCSQEILCLQYKRYCYGNYETRRESTHA
ncbi:MAG: tRNA lysidine(34) synthetase TilS [Firmicutes bacterium]|nr:tRNA lysidine(34) synthetase TilS [Bacillota bacterium]